MRSPTKTKARAKSQAQEPKGEVASAEGKTVLRAPANLFYTAASEERPSVRVGLAARGEEVRERYHSSSTVAVVIRGLESLSETLPAVLQVANGVAPQGIRYTSRDTLISAIDMLATYRNHRESREMESDGKMIANALAAAKLEGIALGIEQEKQRVKEARHGRGRK